MTKDTMYLIVVFTSWIGGVIILLVLFSSNVRAGEGVIKTYDKDGKVTKEVRFNDNDYRPDVRPKPKREIKHAESEPVSAPKGIHVVPPKETVIKDGGNHHKSKDA